MARVFEWNGRDLPPELRSLRPGRYLVEEVDDVPTLSPEEEAGLEAAIASVEAGHGVEHLEARRTIERPTKR